MTPRGLNERVRVSVPGRPVTGTITPGDVEDYLRQTGWQRRNDDLGPIPDARDRSIPLSEVIERIAAHEGCFSGEVLADIAAGRGRERAIRKRKRWPSWP
jgi:hypothetical protein